MCFGSVVVCLMSLKQEIILMRLPLDSTRPVFNISPISSQHYLGLLVLLLVVCC